ncbi:permease [Cellvibrio zantedeschiae]|uniref:Permease n=1 Tax=Cellvibrio zantedeschiae TaxID=1237077 RepID=A0ABQ3BAE2_9GAMM|nr:YoaK family protein [Cellvibrio zantedeschiae]GGY80913.1 permease [Cellvibrio zantedeschiae]
MISKLPKWVEASAFVLAFIAGSVNAIALLGFNHQGVSHLTGSSSLLGVELAKANYAEVIHLGWIILSFVVGAGLSGFAIGNESLRYGRRYGFALLCVALLLVLSMYFLNLSSNLGHYLASAACGLQNAMTSTFSGALMRTTHVTGLFTDLGIIIGLWLRGHSPDKRRVILYLILITGFIVGGLIGAISFTHLTFYAMLIPAALAALLAGIYFVCRQKLIQSSSS